jgi:hypothetical protein
MARKSTRGKPKHAYVSALEKAVKERVTFQLPVALIEKARDVVFFSPGLTMARLMAEALITQIEKVERRHGKPFPSRAGAALRTGRPVKIA